jgi:hypothetical protein
MPSYTSWSVVFGEQPSAAKWNILGTNDSYFDAYIDRSGFPVQIVGNSTTAVATGTTLIPLDDTIPQNTEGDQYMSQAITPTAALNQLEIEAVLVLASSVPNHFIAALFQDTTANALAVAGTYQVTNSGLLTLVLKHTMVAGTASATTFKIRAGQESAGTLTFNGRAAGRLFGAITKSSLTITEYKA